jgi:uncharacterized protein YegL
MTRPDLTHVYFLLDRSGSMTTIKTDIETGFAAFVNEQRHAPGECRVTLAQFDQSYEVVYANRPVADIPPLKLVPRGTTALLDAMGTLITTAGEQLAALPENDRPSTVVLAIMTDGQENSSHDWNRATVSTLVKQQAGEYGWQFLYMGADQDAIEVGTSLGINAEHSVTYARGNSGLALSSISSRVATLRTTRRTDPAAVMSGYTDAERRDLGQ